MAHDHNLNQKIREALKSKRGISEKNMFGGVCFLQYGNMLCGADKKHGLMLRVGPEQYQKTLKLKHTSKMDMTGVPLKGFIFVDPSGYKTKTSLKKWIERAMDFTKTLPKKTK